MPILNDWTRKIVALKILFNADGFPALVDEVFGDAVFKEEEFYREKLTENMHTWYDGVPTRTPRAIKLFEYIAYRLACDESVTAQMLMRSTFDEFINLLPKARRAEAQGKNEILPQSIFMDDDVPVTNLEKTDNSIRVRLKRLNTDIFPMYVFEDGDAPSVRQAAVGGAMDQRVFYQHPDSAVFWESIVTAQHYPTYDKCKYSLDKLWRSQIFLDEMAHNPPDAIVMLGGGGAFGKDVSTISAFLGTGSYTEANPLRYALFDISPWMLRRSLARLAAHWTQTDWGDKVAIELFTGDLMKLNSGARKRELRHGAKFVVWSLTGGTIGNISEAEFFRSLNLVSVPGDTLVLSASVKLRSTVQKAEEEPDDESTSRYLSPSVKSLLRNPLRDLIHELGSRKSVSSVMDALKTRFENGDLEGVTNVPDSHSMIMTADIDGFPCDVFNHTSYCPDALVAFALTKGWSHIDTVYPDHFSPDFAQFYFKKD